MAREEVVWTPEGYVATIDGKLVSQPTQRLIDPGDVRANNLWLFTHMTEWGARRTLKKYHKKLDRSESMKKSLDIVQNL